MSNHEESVVKGVSTSRSIWFGQYKGHKVSTVLEIDPGYILWASEHVSGFNPTKEVLSEARTEAEEIKLHSYVDPDSRTGRG